MKNVNLILSKNSNLFDLKYLLVTLKFFAYKEKTLSEYLPLIPTQSIFKKEKKEDLNKQFGFKTF